jgi:adenylate cyclase
LAALVRTAGRELREPGSSGASGLELWRMGRLGVTVLIVATNVVGVAAVLAAVYLVVPLPPVPSAGHVRAVNAVVAAVYVVLALPFGAIVGTRRLLTVRQWLVEERPAGAVERRNVLLAPARLFLLQVALWFAAAALFGLVDGRYSATLGLYVAVTVAISGMATAACAYLFTERVMRAAAARVMTGGSPERLDVPGVATRALLAWGLGSGLLLLSIVAVGIGALAGYGGSAHQLAVAMVALGGIGLAVGLLAVTLSARATAAPIDAVTRGLEAVQAGRFDTTVAVYDGTQIGKLQRGFNDMVRGLAEREKLRHAFGTYVDPAVAEQVLHDAIAPEGELVEVTVMFVDVRGFTTFAEQTSATDVLAALNDLFAVIVPVVHEHGGRIDKFVGDGLMAVFGAPRRMADHAAEAVRAALEIVRLAGAGRLEFGIGLNSGRVVAGNVGGAGRLEFGVIGDAVNVAARVEAATRQTGDVILLTQRTKELADGAAQFVERPAVALRGKREPVRLFVPLAGEPRPATPGEGGG